MPDQFRPRADTPPALSRVNKTLTPSGVVMTHTPSVERKPSARTRHTATPVAGYLPRPFTPRAAFPKMPDP